MRSEFQYFQLFAPQPLETARLVHGIAPAAALQLIYIYANVFSSCAITYIYIYTYTHTHIAGGVKLRVIDCTLRHQLRGMAEDNVAGLPRPRLPHAAAPCAAASDAPPQPPLTRPRPPPPPLSEEEIVRIAPRPLTCTLALPFLVYAPHVAPSPPRPQSSSQKSCASGRSRRQQVAHAHNLLHVTRSCNAREQPPPLQKQRKSSSA